MVSVAFIVAEVQRGVGKLHIGRFASTVTMAWAQLDRRAWTADRIRPRTRKGERFETCGVGAASGGRGVGRGGVGKGPCYIQGSGFGGWSLSAGPSTATITVLRP